MYVSHLARFLPGCSHGPPRTTHDVLCRVTRVSQERMAVALSAVASCEVALDQTLEYVKRRTMFGRRLGDLQYPAIKVCRPLLLQRLIRFPLD